MSIAKDVSRRGLVFALSLLMMIFPFPESLLAAQPAAPPPGPQVEPLPPEELDRLVAPIALYPDALVAQILTASTYPDQVSEADRWRQAQGNASPEQIADAANAQNWDPSVKALTAFPAVLERMDRNIQWTTDLGNAYYNQPQDVMDSVQEMRHRAYSAGTLRSSPQQRVVVSGGVITILPADPALVYVPYYDPWAVWGYTLAPYPGFYYAAPPGIVFGGLMIGFGVGIPIVLWSHWGWGWHHWRMGWHDRAIYYNRARYFTHSRTVINRGFAHRGGPGFRTRGPAGRPSGNLHRRSEPPVRRGEANRPRGSFRAPVHPGGGRHGGVTRPGGGRPSGARPGGRPGAPGRAGGGRGQHGR